MNFTSDFYQIQIASAGANGNSIAQSSSIGDDDDEDEESNQEFVNWVVDKRFVPVKKQHSIPDDPKNWTEAHVQIWLKWAINQFNLRLQENEWRFNGQQLCELTLPVFQKKVPRDPGNKFWTHLELLRKCRFITIPGDPKSANEDEDDTVSTESTREKAAIFKKNARVMGKPIKSIKSIANLDASGVETLSPSQGNRTGNNGQIQLW